MQPTPPLKHRLSRTSEAALPVKGGATALVARERTLGELRLRSQRTSEPARFVSRTAYPPSPQRIPPPEPRAPRHLGLGGVALGLVPESERLDSETPRAYTFPGPPPRRARAGQDTGRGMAELDIADCIDDTRPRSGEPVRADSPTLYDGRVVGLCSDRFRTAIRLLDRAAEAIR